MSSIEEWLSSGDLRTDGAANEVADLVQQNPHLIDELFTCLQTGDKVVRGHAADAVEKVARSSPELLVDRLVEIIDLAIHDEVAMVRWHAAMILGHLSMYAQHIGVIRHTLLQLLDDPSVFTQSWAIVSLCIIARVDPKQDSDIVAGIERLRSSDSIAIRSKVRQAMDLLLNDNHPFPQGWIKSPHLQELITRAES